MVVSHDSDKEMKFLVGSWFAIENSEGIEDWYLSIAYAGKVHTARGLVLSLLLFLLSAP